MGKGVADKLVTTIDCKQRAVRAVRFNVDGNYCLTCGSDKSLKLWNPHRGTLLKTYVGHGYEVLDAQSASDSSQLCSCGLDKHVILWDVATGKMVRKYRGHAAQVNCVKFNEESTVILSGSLDGTVQAWDCRTRKNEPIQVMNEAKDSVTSIQVTDFEILTGSADNCVRRYDIRLGRLQVDCIGSVVSCVNFTRDGQCILAGTQDSRLRLLDKESGELLNEFKGHKNMSYKIDSCLNSEDTHILSGSEDGFVYIWDLVEAKLTGKLQHEPGKTVHSLSYHPTDCCLLTATGGSIRVWKSKADETVD